MLRTLIFLLLIMASSVCYGHNQVRTNSPAYHQRHYSFSYVRPQCYQPYYSVPRPVPMYAPRNYYGYPYGAYRNYNPGFYFQLQVR